MHGMVEVTLVRGGEELMEDPTSEVAVRRRGRVSFIPSEFSIRRNVRGYSLPTRWSYMLHEYGAYSGPFCLPAVGSTVVMEEPIDWGSVEALPASSEMRVTGDVSTGSTSGEGDSATPDARTWNAATQSVAPTEAWTARTASTVVIVE